MTKTPFYTQFKEEHRYWVEHNFPNAKPHEPLLGLVEEYGELLDANLICDFDKEQDAVGDMLVYLTHYCNMFMIDWADCANLTQFSYKSMMDWAFQLGIEIGKLSHAQLKGEQSIRHTSAEIHEMKKRAIGNIVVMLENWCTEKDFFMMDCLEATWNEVKQRDWKKNNLTGT